MVISRHFKLRPTIGCTSPSSGSKSQTCQIEDTKDASQNSLISQSQIGEDARC